MKRLKLTQTMKNWLLGSMLLISSVAVAQNYDVNWGEKARTKAKYGQLAGQVLGQTNDAVFQQRTRIKAIYAVYFILYKYYPYLSSLNPEDLSMIDSKPYFPKGLFPSDAGKPELLSTSVIDNKLVALVSTFDRKNKRVQFWAQEYDGSCEPAGKPVKLARVKTERKADLNGLKGFFSENKAYSGFYFKPKSKRKDDESFSFFVYDQEYAEVANMRVTFPVQNRYFEMEEVLLTNDKRFVVLAAVYDDENAEQKGKKRRSDSWVYHLFLFKYGETEEPEVLDVPLEIKGKYVTGLTLRAKDRYLECAGYYGDRPGMSSGVIYFKYDLQTESMGEPVNQPFDKEILADFQSSKKGLLGGKGKDVSKDAIARLTVLGLYPTKLGGSYIVGEQRYVHEVCTQSSQGGISCTYYYHYENLVVSYVGEDNEIKWSRRISKLGLFGTKSGSTMSESLTAMLSGVGVYIHHDPTNDRLHFFFNDSPANEKVLHSGKANFAKVRNANIVAVSTGMDGKFTKKILYNSKEKKVVFNPLGSSQIADRIGIFAHQRGKKQANAILTITDR
jgi:hypothetical protein